jgi:predicted nuclease of predicted toxin-antitoxin system
MALFYADENFDYGVVERLRIRGHDVLTVQEAGEQGRDDARVLERATAENRCVLTFDRPDFRRLHHHSSAHAGIVSCTRDNDRDALTARIHQAVSAAGSVGGQHIHVNRPA